MTAGETCMLLVNSIRELSATRGERDAWRMLALAAIRHSSELTRELEMVDARLYIHRTRTQDNRDVVLDQRDLRLVANQLEPGTEAA